MSNDGYAAIFIAMVAVFVIILLMMPPPAPRDIIVTIKPITVELQK